MEFKLIPWLVLVFLFALMLYYNFNTSLGELNGFDSTHYLNMVTGNIGLNPLNSKSVVHGTFAYTLSSQYTFQSYFYVISCLLFAFEKGFSLFGVNFYPAIGYIWIFQILYNFIFLSIIGIALNKFFNKKYVFGVVVTFFFILCYFRLYYNSAFGFYGNTYRTIILAYTSLFMIEWFLDSNRNSKILFGLSLLAACAASSSAVFMVFFLLFAMFFVLIDKEDQLFKEYAIILLFPAINLITILFSKLSFAIIASIVLCGVLFFGNDILIKYIRKYKLKWILLIASTALMLFLSYRVTGNLFDFNAFFYSSSEQYDMTLNYFREVVGYKTVRYYKIVSIVVLTLTLIFKRKEKMTQVFYVLILVFFNPFCCSFLNEINVVYYRAYDLILNPFTLIWMLYMITTLLEFKYVYYIEMFALFMVMLGSERPDMLLYWHGSFAPEGDYNYIYKMSENEVDIINQLEYIVESNEIAKPKIITPNLRTLSMIPDGIYIYGREYQKNKTWSESEKELYKIFYPVLYWNDPGQPENPDYKNMCQYIEDANIDFIVQPKKTEYYDESQNIWYALTYKINDCGSYPIYENDEYALYMYER